MNHNTQGVSRNGNQGGSGQTRLEPVAGCKSLEYPAQNTSEVGAGYPYATGSIASHAAPNTRHGQGGQASLGLFGIPGISFPQPRAKAPAPAVAAHLRRDRREVSVRPSERDELFDGSPVQMTPAMHAAAGAADERDRRGYVDDEEADFAHRCAGAGYVEAQLAIEG